MERPNRQSLKYGVIYIYLDPMRRIDSLGGMSIIEKIAHPFEIEWIEDHDRGPDNTLLVARRFNVGNMGQCATVSLRLSDRNSRGVQFDALHEFREKLFEVKDMTGGDIVIDEDDFMPKYCCRRDDVLSDMVSDAPRPWVIQPSAAPQDNTRVESIGEKLKKKASKWLPKRGSSAKGLPSGVEQCILPENESEPETDLLDDERLEVMRLERERAKALEQIKRDIIAYIARYHDDPQDLMAELLRGKVVVGAPGRVLVNGDMKVVLPEFDEMEVKMPAMCRTLYILFMKLRHQGEEGIVLRNIDEYRNELIDIYSMVKPGADHNRVVASVDNLCDPLSDSLNQTISRINRCVRNVITDKALARDYCITGERGQEYGILLDPQYLELPRAVTGA